MGNKRKESWLLKDPNFVPKNKKVRVVLYLIINLILISLFPILIIFINHPYGYLCWIPVFCILIIFNRQSLLIHLKRYPLNDYCEYRLNLNRDQFSFDENNYYVEVNKCGHLYEVNLKDKVLTFDMTGCLFPIIVIKAYLGRQFIIAYINKFKLYSDYMAKNLNILKAYKNYKNLKFIYNKNGNKKESYLIKDGKTKMSGLMKLINGHGFPIWHLGNGRIRNERYHFKITEDIFVEDKYKNN